MLSLWGTFPLAASTEEVYYGLNVRIPLKFILKSEHAKVMVLEEGAVGRH